MSIVSSYDEKSVLYTSATASVSSISEDIRIKDNILYLFSYFSDYKLCLGIGSTSIFHNEAGWAT